MIKKIFFFVLLTVFCLSTNYAAYISNYPVTVTQPDGTTLACFASGDEFYNWLHDANNFTIIQNPKTGFYCYAIKNGDAVVASSHIAGRIDPVSAGLTAGISISAEAKKARRDAFLKNTPDITQSKDYKSPKGTKNIGQMNNLVVYIRFNDQSEYSQDTNFYWEMFNATADPQEQSMKNYFQQVSYNQLDITTSFFPVTVSNIVVSYQDEHPRAYYMPYSEYNPIGYNEDNDERSEREFQLLADAVAFIENQVPEDLNIDYNDDGLVDNVCFIIKGGTTAWSTLLWPHRWALYGQDAYIHGKRVWDFNFQLSDFLVNSRSSVLCHEMFHSLGAPDLYRYNDETINPVGSWDVMSANANPAQSMCAYMKWKYGGWLENIPEITEGGVYTINTPWSQENCIYKIASPNSTTEYFTVEYRNKSFHHFEQGIPGSGLLIYRINPLYDGNADGPPDEVYIFRPYGINTLTNGSLSEAYFSVESGRTVFGDNTNPPCFLSDDTRGGILIRNISNVGEQMTFEVIFDIVPEADFTASQEIVTTDCAVDFEGKSYNVVNEWLWEFEDGVPATSNEQNPTGITFTSTGQKTISLTVSNVHGATTTTKQNFINVSASMLPTADFYTHHTAICPDYSVQLFDSSTICPIAWEWTFSPNSVTFMEGTTSNSQNPIVQFNNSDDYSVTLTASNINGSSSITKTNYITTKGMSPNNYWVDFSDINSFEEIGWKVENEGNNNHKWELYTFENGKKAAYMQFYQNTELLKKDYLILPTISLDDSYKFSFKHAYTLSSNNYSDTLYISISTDCGITWERIAGFAEDQNYSFATAPRQSLAFIPNNDQWCGNSITNTPCNSVDLSNYRGTVLLRFETVRITGNNLFISEVSFDKCLGINEQEETNAIQIYPNPGTGNYYISCAEIQGTADITVFNAQGKSVLTMQSNTTKTPLDLTNQPKGIYFVVFTTETFTKSLKIIKM